MTDQWQTQGVPTCDIQIATNERVITIYIGFGKFWKWELLHCWFSSVWNSANTAALQILSYNLIQWFSISGSYDSTKWDRNGTFRLLRYEILYPWCSFGFFGVFLFWKPSHRYDCVYSTSKTLYSESLAEKLSFITADVSCVGPSKSIWEKKSLQLCLIKWDLSMHQVCWQRYCSK